MPSTGLTIDFINTKLIEAEQYFAELVAQDNFNVENNTDNDEELKCHLFELYYIIQGLKYRVSRDILDDTTITLYYKLERSVGVGTSTQIVFDPFYVDFNSWYTVNISIDLSAYALDSSVVHKTMNETINGIKTFLLSPTVPDAISSNQALSLGQADARFSPIANDGTVTTVSVVTANGFTGSVANSTTTPAITLALQNASSTQNGQLLGTDWVIFNSKQAALGFTPENIVNKSTTTTLGTSNNLYPTQNAVKVYVDNSISGSGFVPSSRTLTINGSTFDLSTNRTWTVGDALVANPLSQFASTTSAQLRSVLSDETGTGLAYFQGGDIGTPSAGIATNLSGIAAFLTSGLVTSIGNLTGDVTSINRATSVAFINGITKNYYDPTSSIQTQLNSKIGLTALSATSPIFYSSTTGIISSQAATSGQNGYLTSTDWSIFNNKQNAITFGTEVLTALGVNIGSAGSPVLFNGAGGTPSSLTLTNATGLPYSGLTGTVPTWNQNTTGSAAKWTTGRTLSITGDIAYTSPSFDGSGNITAAATLPTVNSNVGSFNTVTVNAKGLVIAASNTSYTPLSNLAGTTGYIQKSTGTGTIGNSLYYDDGTYGYFGYNPVTPLSYLTFSTPSITSALIKFTGTPDSLGAQHAQIVMDRDYSNYNYGSYLRFYTEAKNTANFTDTSRDVGGFNSLGNFDVLGTFYSGGKATIEGGTVSFPFLQGGTYLGYQAGNSSIPNSTYNTFVGYQVGHTTTTGYNNTGVGLQTLSAVTSGYANTGIGLQTLLAATTAQFNFAGSIHALYSLIDGVANNAIGAGSLEYNLHGGGNNALGMYAGRSYMGNGSLFLGHQAGGLDSSSLDNQLYIANNQTTPLIYGIFDPNPYVRILGAFQTDGIDTYNSDLSLSYTSRTKIDKGYADGRYSLLAGGSSLTTVGTVTSGIWHGTPIADSYIASSSIWTNKIDMNNGIYTGYLTGPGGTLVNWTGGGVNNAIYSTTVTPSNSNYTLFHNGTYSTLSASTQTSLGINGSAILAVTSAGASISGSVTASQFKLSALNTAPSSSTDTGALGEIRITSTYIYTCIATNTWVRSALTTF